MAPVLKVGHVGTVATVTATQGLDEEVDLAVVKAVGNVSGNITRSVASCDVLAVRGSAATN